MKISELASVSQTSLSTIKFYLREGLVQPGIKTDRNQADYDNSHVQRLRLIKALTGVGGLTVSQAAAVIAEISGAPADAIKSMKAGQRATLPPTSTAIVTSDESRSIVDAVLTRHGWVPKATGSARLRLIEIVDLVSGARPDLVEQLIDKYADAAEAIAEHEISAVVTINDAELLAEAVVLGTVLGDTAIAMFRRIAQESIGIERGSRGRRQSGER